MASEGESRVYHPIRLLTSVRMPALYMTIMLLVVGIYRQKVSDMAATMLNAVRKFSKDHQTTDLALIQIVIFDSSMCAGFAQALQSAVKDSESLFSRAKRKCIVLLQGIIAHG